MNLNLESKRFTANNEKSTQIISNKARLCAYIQINEHLIFYCFYTYFIPPFLEEVKAKSFEYKGFYK